MGKIAAAGDFVFKSFTVGLGIATVYLAGNFAVNLYRGFSWHAAQPKLDKDGTEKPPQ